MCGICGIVRFGSDNDRPRAFGVTGPAGGSLPAGTDGDAGVLEAMTLSLAHRGPDDQGFFRENNVGLGHRRLSIIDLSGGSQPIFNEDRSIVIVFNGEIYNFAELSVELMARGHTFRTRSDTEAIVHAYEEFGEDAVDRLRGMFAFAIWDRRRRRLFLSRDRLGIKPLYYYEGRDFLAFASEIKALLCVPGVPRDVDETALDHYLWLRYVPGPRTMFRGIRKLQPGHYLVLDENGMRIRKYWDVGYDDPMPAGVDIEERFLELLEESVDLRMIAEVPLGVFLSGGLDSSAILAVMSKLRRGEPIKTFSVGYAAADGGEDENNEFYYARQAARAFGADHHEFCVSPVDFRDFVPQLVWDLDEPLADPSCIPLYFIARLAREFITVVLSGEGADEILAGYGIYQKMLAIEKVRAHVPFASPLARALAAAVPNEKYERYLRMAALPLELRYRGVSRGILPSLRSRLLNGRVHAGETVDDIYLRYFDAVCKAQPLNRMLYVDAKVWLPDDLLLKADKMTMANALELRVPFLDHKLVEYAARLPLAAKVHAGAGKALLRETMSKVLPAEILSRPKKGFPVPTHTWLRGQLAGFTREALLSRDSACARYFERAAVEKMVFDQERGWADRHQELWTLLIFEFWHRVYVEQSIRPAARRADFAQTA